eukprot:3451223-Alexandrium_andersonii.AAC.1
MQVAGHGKRTPPGGTSRHTWLASHRELPELCAGAGAALLALHQLVGDQAVTVGQRGADPEVRP